MIITVEKFEEIRNSKKTVAKAEELERYKRMKGRLTKMIETALRNDASGEYPVKTEDIKELDYKSETKGGFTRAVREIFVGTCWGGTVVRSANNRTIYVKIFPRNREEEFIK